MTMQVLKRGLNHVLLTFMFVGSILSIHAAELETAVNTFSGEAEKWGLWPVLAISMVVASMAYAWSLSQKNDALVERVMTSYETVMRNTADELRGLRGAIKDAPCGRNLPDSDADNPEHTPSRADRTMQRRAARQHKGSEGT